MKCIAVLFSAAHLLLLSVPAADGRVVDLAASRREKQFRTVGKVNSGTLDFVALRAAETTETKHFFRHGRHLLDALAGGHATFEVAEIENDDAAWNLHAQSSYHEIADKAFHDTRTVYTLHGGDGAYVNLDGVPDHHAAAAVRDISDTHLVHCPAPGGAGGVTAAPAPGALVVGSAGGPWSTAAPPHVARFLESSLRRLHPHHAAAKHEHGLLIARRVAAVRRLVDDGHGCLHLETEDVHPLELFSKMRLESYIEQPQRFYSGLTAATMAAHRQRHDPTKPTANPDTRALFTETPYFNANLGYPVTSCTDTEWSPFTNGFWGRYSIGPTSVGNVDVELSLLNGGCVEYSATLASFNYNYNGNGGPSQVLTPPTGPQTTTIGGATVTGQVSGVECTSCYAYLGAGITIIVEYQTGYTYTQSAGTLGAEIQVGGAAGMDAQVTLNSPSASGEVSVSNFVAGSSSWDFNLAIGSTGLTFKGKFGGIDLDVKGSVTSTGGAKFGTGSFAFTAAAGAAYSSNNGLSVIGTSTFSSTPAYFNYLTPPLAVTAASMTMSITPKTLLEATYGITGASISLDGTAAVQINARYSYGTGSYTSSAAVVHPATTALAASAAAADAAAVSPAAPTYVPGDVVTVAVTYGGFTSNETVIVYYALTNTDTGEETPITRDLVVPDATGAGTIQTTWTVPWARLFAIDLDGAPISAQIVVRFSNHFHVSSYSTQPFKLVMFTETDGIITAPKSGKVVPVDAPVAVVWDPALLFYFNRTTFGGHSGDIVNTTRVVFEVTGELVDAAGHALQPPVVRRLPAGGQVFNNTGTALLVFPRNLTERSNRFYVTVHDVDNFVVQGWSKGYFKLGNDMGEAIAPSASVMAAATALSAVPSAHPTAPSRASMLEMGRRDGRSGATDVAAAAGESSPRVHAEAVTCTGHLFTPGLGIGGSATSVGVSVLGSSIFNQNFASNGGLKDTSMPGGACLATLPPSPAPSAAPSSAPTPLPTALPTQVPVASGPSGSSSGGGGSSSGGGSGAAQNPPTPGPTAPQVTQVQETQTLQGVDVTTASTPAFKAALITTVAASLGVNPSAVTVLSVVAARRRRLLAGVAVTYSVTTTAMAVTTLNAKLATAITTGAFTAALVASSGVTTVAATAPPTFVDYSPTAAPTTVPPPPAAAAGASGGSATGAIAGGVAGGVVALLLLGGLGFVMYRRSARATVRVAVDNQAPPHAPPQAPPAAGGGAVQLAPVPVPQPAAPPPVYVAPPPQQQQQPPIPSAAAATAATPAFAPPTALPPGWVTQTDPTSGAPFYVYTSTGHTQWNRP